MVKTAFQHPTTPNNDPGQAQRRATAPGESVWVSASAGAGKTTVLTSRVLRLLLPREDGRPGTPPHRILCLTFTKAAASEMALRINKTLSAWAAMSDDALHAELRDKLLEREPTEAELQGARQLFASVIDAPGGLQIMTIHAFCGALLGRFPLEAGLPPHFKQLDDAAAQELLQQARNNILEQAAREPDSMIGTALAALAAVQSEDGFDGMLQKIVSERHQLARLTHEQGGIEGLCGALYETLGIKDNDTADNLIRTACEDNAFDKDSLYRACNIVLEKGTAKFQERAATIQLWLNSTIEDRAKTYHTYKRAFLKVEGSAFADITNKKIADSEPHVENTLHQETDRILALEDKLKALRSATLTRAFLTMGWAVLDRYEALKQQYAALDFDDLINRTLDLLQRPDIAPWVMFKLDGGLDHILIDEAQDTNPEQWQVIRLLCDDFFTGESARSDRDRTIFTVGDEKQSIYSFQRAAPEKFRAMQAYFSDKITQAGKELRSEDLITSFRSVPAVLRFVDAVFADDTTRRGLGQTPLHHISYRADHAGLTELWPLFETPKRSKDDNPWAPPIKTTDSRSGAAQMADHIGNTVEGWLKNGDILPSRDRPITAGDILILVRKRTTLVEQLIRALKTRHIPVGGVDRMVLRTQLPVQDMMALAQFALFPEDDLSLACALKSPLLGWDDQALETIAAPREGTLWQALCDSDQTATIAYLRNLIVRAGADHPYEFFSRLLQQPCPGNDMSGLRAITARLGIEAVDPLDEFLNATLAYETDHIPTVQGFLHWASQGDSDIKREQEEAGGRVRIMTVHGAKGLQAPIVILPDTVRLSKTPPSGTHRFLWPDKTGFKTPLWSPRKDDDCTLYADALARFEDKQDEEYRRLLYVAMTRAEDRLYIGGYIGVQKPKPEIMAQSWYGMARTAMTQLEDIEQDGDGSLRLRSEQKSPAKPDKPSNDQTYAAIPSTAALPDWLRTAPAPEPHPPRPLIPSRPAPTAPAARSPLADADTYRFRRGILTHRLLQLLPDLPAERREKAARRFISKQGADMPEDIQTGIITETMAILTHPDYAALFGPDSLAEVPVTGLTKDGTLVSGQIDRLLVTDQEVLIIDYKTNRPPPQHPDDIPAIYQQQMKSYSDIVSKIYPGRPVRCFLLWTDGPSLMALTHHKA